MTARQQALKLIEEYGAELHDWGNRDQFLGAAETPTGKIFTATDCHTIALNFHTDRPAGWQFLLNELRTGVQDCTDPNCEMCEKGPSR